MQPNHSTDAVFAEIVECNRDVERSMKAQYLLRQIQKMNTQAKILGLHAEFHSIVIPAINGYFIEVQPAKDSDGNEIPLMSWVEFDQEILEVLPKGSADGFYRYAAHIEVSRLEKPEVDGAEPQIVPVANFDITGDNFSQFYQGIYYTLVRHFDVDVVPMIRPSKTLL